MKNKIGILLIAIFLLKLSVCSFAAQAANTLTAVVYVQSLFQLSLTQDKIEFSKAKRGKTVDSDSPVTVITKTSSGNKWQIQVSSDHPLTFRDRIISNDHFFWYGETKGDGKWVQKEPANLSEDEQLAYISSNNETDNTPDGTKNDFKFRLYVPVEQDAGTYSSTVMFTMTE